MRVRQKAAAAVITFMVLVGCVDSGGQGDRNEAEARSRLLPVILQAEGIAQGDGLDFPYGTEKAEVIAMLERFGPVSQSSNEECGAGPMDIVSSSATGLTLNFQEGQLVGWFFDGDGKLARTAQDITVGSTRSDLEAALPIEMQTDSTLGIEFFSGSGENGFIAGFLSDESKNATVESLYSGTNCFFR